MKHTNKKKIEPTSTQATQAKSSGSKLVPPPSGISFVDNPIQKKNNTGLPDQLKSGVESLSGIDISDVKVHYNSSQPAQLNAHAYAQGNQIHVAPGQEKHLPHEAWHVVQQKQGRVKPTKQLKGKVSINDDVELEKEADVMGSRALQLKLSEEGTQQNNNFIRPIVQKRAWGGAGGLMAGPLTPINDVIVQGNPFQGIQFTHVLPVSVNRTAALAAAANFISGLGVPVKNNFLAQKFLNDNNVAQTILPAPAPGQLAPAGWPAPATWNNYRNPNNVDPFLVEVTASYPNPAGAVNHQVILTYEFGKASYGYIVRIQQGGGNFTMNTTRGQNTPLGPNEYASGHDTHANADDVSGIALQDTDPNAISAAVPDRAISWPMIGAASALVGSIMAYTLKTKLGALSGLAIALGLSLVRRAQEAATENDRRKERSKRLDSITKIAGEGARWQCVQAAALAGTLRNSSKFYTQNPGGVGFRYVTFQTLWGAWGTIFQSAFSIPNATVAAALNNPANAIHWGANLIVTPGPIPGLGPNDHLV